MKTQECAQKLRREIAKIFIGKEEQLSLILMSVFVGGHVLLDDLPGSGKTTLIKTLSRALGCECRRVQFTPDLLPSDIIGMTVFDQKTGGFRQIKGPVFTHLLLADEINRAIPRTQSALAEIDYRGEPTRFPVWQIAAEYHGLGQVFFFTKRPDGRERELERALDGFVWLVTQGGAPSVRTISETELMR